MILLAGANSGRLAGLKLELTAGILNRGNLMPAAALVYKISPDNELSLSRVNFEFQVAPSL